jgi:serine/threonine protein kinase
MYFLGDLGLMGEKTTTLAMLQSVAGTAFVLSLFFRCCITLVFVMCIREYMSPEILAHKPCESFFDFLVIYVFLFRPRFNEKTDIFSLGVVVCELLTGATPQQLDVIPRRATTPPTPAGARERWNSLSLRMREFILLLLDSVFGPLHSPSSALSSLLLLFSRILRSGRRRRRFWKHQKSKRW